MIIRSFSSLLGPARTLGIRVVIEFVPVVKESDTDSEGRIESDSYVMLAEDLRFAEIVRESLAKTGYLEELPYAKGTFLRTFFIVATTCCVSPKWAVIFGGA